MSDGAALSPQHLKELARRDDNDRMATQTLSSERYTGRYTEQHFRDRVSAMMVHRPKVVPRSATGSIARAVAAAQKAHC